MSESRLRIFCSWVSCESACSVEPMCSKVELMKPCSELSSSWMLALNSR